MEFEMSIIGAEQRANFHRKNPDYSNHEEICLDWTPIEIMSRVLSKTFQDGFKINRTQIPLAACNGNSCFFMILQFEHCILILLLILIGMTIAKSQGSTLPYVVVSMRGTGFRRLTPSEKYVACSRAKSIDGLFIDGDFTPPVLPSNTDPVGDEMCRLRRDRKLQFSLRFLQDIYCGYKVYFHNCQSLNAHYNDIIADPCVYSADLLIFVEPHLLPEDDVQIPGYKCIHRADCERGTRRTAEGTAVFLKGRRH